MQMIGEEQNIQALFRELRLDDERITPRFEVLWNSAQANARPARAFRLSFVTAIAILVLTLFSLALWLRDRRSNREPNVTAAIPSPAVNENPMPDEMKAELPEIVPVRTNSRANSRKRSLRLAAQRRAELLALKLAEIRNAAAISSWQSPTAMLMQSPADDVVTSLPQLYQSVSELNSFLPDTQK